MPLTQSKPRKVAAQKPAARKSASKRTKNGYNPAAPERVSEILKRLDQRYPGVTCALHHKSPWELLVATILSAQCTDVRVNMVTPILFKKYPSPADFAAPRPVTAEPGASGFAPGDSISKGKK